MSNPKSLAVGTHSGPFHADEATGIAILKLAFPDWRFEIIRTRNPEVLKTCNFRVDVGGVHNPDSNDFDHHQDKDAVKAAAGLVWDIFGFSACGSSQVVADKVYAAFIQHVDNADLGRGERGGFSFSQQIHNMNPLWTSNPIAADFDEDFECAVDVAGCILEGVIRQVEAEVEAESIAMKAIAQAKGHPVLVLDFYAPVMNYVVEHSETARFLVFPAVDGSYQVQCVPDAIGSFGQRQSLPLEWAALRGDQLQAISGVADAIFCHPGRFICGAQSLTGALELAALASLGIPGPVLV